MLRSLLTWIGIIIYTILVVTQHENVQAFLGPLADRMGRSLFYNLMGSAAVLMGISVTWLFWRASSVSAARIELRVSMAIALIFTLASFSILTVNNAEIVHYPQYAILAILLFPWFRSMGETVAWCTLVGLLDEGYQYFVLHPHWGVPWDFNDVVLDICGGWIGTLLIASHYKAIPNSFSTWWKHPGLLTLFTSVATLPILVALNKIQLYENKNYVGWWFALSRLRVDKFWFYDATWGTRTVHLLTPTEGPILMVLLVLISSWVDRKFSFAK